MKRYNNEKEIFDLVRSFEDGTITREAWHHAEHLTVALHYLCLYEIEEATERIRSGIFNLLRNAFNVDLTKEMPYHETLTVFWIRTVADFNVSKNGVSLLEKANELVAIYDKDHPFKFYSRELLFSDVARRSFVAGDLESAKHLYGDTEDAETTTNE